MAHTSSKSVLVTGGTGFIGRHLCRSLDTLGHRVTVLTRTPGKVKLAGEVRQIAGPDELDKPFSFDWVVNLAGEPLAEGRWNTARKQRFRDSRIGFTEDLLQAFRAGGSEPEVLLNGSAIGFYGPHDDEILAETGAAVPSFSHQLCRDWEASADGFAELGTRVCKVRIGVVLGPGGGSLSRMLLPFKLGLGGPLGSGGQWFSWIHLDDLVRLFIHCLEHQTLPGIVNGTAPEPVRNRAFAEALGGALSRPARLPMPAWALVLLYGEMAEELLLSGQRVYPAVALESGFEFRFPTIESALKDIVQGP
ncbi:TIGR01777 family protein [Exilibacterium tricleocarpae]|uniref:TIGR01777 family protein n=1 Tax=Exilibacterium tricleocarpae TaxID=2591008 RepID=A0A545T886_9GAMM|nr:TIGR01777 family oxidoreductase [Exilibacterium tricleocarpae]TQV73430.1 TIGR01777 family protein [Exilibacterium tricleocarpae]